MSTDYVFYMFYKVSGYKLQALQLQDLQGILATSPTRGPVHPNSSQETELAKPGTELAARGERKRLSISILTIPR